MGNIRKIIPSIISDAEDRKVSFWLEKLFNQQKDKEVEKGILEKGIKTPINIQDSTTYDTGKSEQTSEEKGKAEAVKNHASKAEKNRQAVEDMVNNSNRILLKVSSVFPWDFFPTTIVVEETRVTIISRQLFSSQTHSVDIKNISNIFIDSGILFAQLTIVSNTFAENQIIIDRLWKKDAILIRRIIEGMRMFVSRDIDTTGYGVKELLSKLRELSTTRAIK